jgi:DNA (cytosine-5)-methyltransferase 1
MSDATSHRAAILDLYSGAGGCAAGYERAGLLPTGVDAYPQPRYPFRFHQAGALSWLEHFLTFGEWPDGERYDAIHASPPCQAFTVAGVIHDRPHHDLLTPTRSLLEQTGLPWIIENVPQAPMRVDLELCGSMFDLRSENGRLIRHRWFEFGGPWTPPSPMVFACNHSGKTISVFGHGGHVYHGVEDWRNVMGIDWMTRDELAQAIPPAFTEYIGAALLESIEVAA